MVLAGVVLPIAANWAWSGWLAHKGFFDVAGGCSLHLASGVFAAVGAVILRPRSGKFNRDRSSSMIPGHNVTLTSVGAILLIIGWTAYVSGGGAYHISQGTMTMDVNELKTYVLYVGASAWNVVLCAAGATIGSIVYTQVRYRKPDVVLILTGMLGGLVSISAGGMILPSWSAVLIGMVAGVIVPAAVVALDLRVRIDDPGGAIAIHGVGGALGTLAVGLFMPRPLAHGRLQQIEIQSIGIVAIALLAALVGTIFFLAFNAAGMLRAREADEFDGLDLAEHDIGAYPDFQQTTIKSYHLREA
jgi:Amt family ammonium transporter